MTNVILASSSIYRRELLSRLKIPFTTFSPDVDETRLEGETIQEMVLRLSEKKAQEAAKHHPQSICIGSDEVAGLGESILGKPGNHQNALAQLAQMSGQTVIFYTGVSVVAPHLQHIDTKLSLTTVKFRSLTSTMIENYLNKEKPYSSAGSFKSETLGSALLESFESDDPTAIIGLPLIMLCRMLERAGVEII